MKDFHDTCSLKASDMMCSHVITLSPDDTLERTLQTLLEKKISGAPVTDPENRVVGVISEYALMDLLFDPELKTAPVSSHMSTDTVTVHEDDPATKLAHLFVLYRIRRLPVVRDERLVGIVSRRDLLRRFAESEYAVPEPLYESPTIDFDDVVLEES